MRRFSLGVALVAALLGACASGQAETPDDAGSFPVTVSGANGEVTLQTRPESIVSLSPSATEMLFGIGAGDQVVAVDEFSYFPSEAPVTDLSGFTPNIEAIVSYEPDLVVVSDDIDGVVGQLQGLDVPVLQLPAAAALSDVYLQIEELGTATGHAGEAASLADEMAEDIQAAVDGAGSGTAGLTYYHELDPTFYSVTSATFVGEIYALFGLDNIADPADEQGFGYPQLSEEYILESNPDLVFVTDAYGDTPDSVAARPGWSSLDAVAEGGVVVLDADVASRWGPRVVELVETIGDALVGAR